MSEDYIQTDMPQEENCDCCRHKDSPRDPQLQRQLQNRINRVMGQLNGIKKMLDENRYCGDILIQISAVESAMKALGFMVLHDHMKTCVTDQVRLGNDDVIDETLELMKKLK